MNGKITYHQQVSFCGKPRCRKCREGKGHGPYWYAYQTTDGHTTRTYIGKNLPPGVQAPTDVAAINAPAMSTPRSAGLSNLVENASTTDSTPTIHLFTLGQFRLERRQNRQWQTVSDAAWQQPRVRTLLGCLISCSGRRASRSQLVKVLRIESDPQTASEQLNRAIHALRQVLEPGSNRRGARAEGRLLRNEGEWLTLADQSRVWVDADAFERLLSPRSSAASGDDQASREIALREAAELYAGDYLPEERRADWVLVRRQALRRGWIGLLLELADLYIAQDATTSALEVLDRLLSTDPSNEAAVRRFIYVMARLKRRGEALRAYHRLADVLRREYNTLPSADTHQLYEAVRQGHELPVSQVSNIQFVNSALSTTHREIDQAELHAQPEPENALTHSSTAQAAHIDSATMQIGRTHQRPLVGRELELDTLRSMLLDVEQRVWAQPLPQRRAFPIPLDTQRRPQCMVLMGEAGIGKTRLAEEMSREALRRGWSVIWSRIYQQESGIPYHLWTEVLRRALSNSGLLPTLPRMPILRGLNPASTYRNSTQAAIQQMWRGGDLAWSTNEATADEALLLEERGYREPVEQEHGLLSLQPLIALLPELETVFPTLSFSSQIFEQEELRLWEAARDLLIAASKSSPLLIVLDDIQWADDSSCKLLGYLARHVYSHPIVLVATCRDTELPTQPPHPLRSLIAHMQRERSVVTLQVNPLSSEEIGQLVSHLPPPMVQHIQDQAAGNPFFAEELARSTPPTMPDTIAAALDHRMSRLSDSCRQLLENAAVLGGSFEFPMLAGMEASGAADEDIMLDLLEEALQSGVLTEEGTGTHITYHFWHPLLVSHLYERIFALRRARLHRRAATILQRMHQGREEEVAATITHHLVQGGAEAELIARYAELAGDRAYSLSAYAEARRHYQLALESLGLPISTITKQPSGSLTTPTLPASSTPEARAHILNLLELLAECTMMRNFEEARHLYEYILALREEQWATVSPQDYQYEIQKEALLWGEIGWTWRYTGDNAQARSCCEYGEHVLQKANILGGPAWARLYLQQGSLYWQEGRYAEARRVVQQSLTLFAEQQKAHIPSPPPTGPARTTRIQRTLQGDPVDLGSAHRLLGALADAEGRADEALDHLNTALVIFEQADHKRRIAHVSQDLSYVYIKTGEFELAHAALRRALNLAISVGDDPLIAVVYSNQGELAAATDDLEEAETWYRRSLALAEQINDREYISRWNSRLAAVLREHGKLDDAATCIKRALSLGRAMPNAPCIASALVALSNLRISQASRAQKLPIVQKRLLIHAEQDARRALSQPGLEAETRVKAQLALAHISLLLNEPDAHQKISSIIDEARSCRLALVEKRAKQLLEL